MVTDIEQNLFVEQAEYLDAESFQAWTTEHPDEDQIVRKLSQTGAKLIVGPRGSGKTTLLLKAFHRMLRDPNSSALPIYVNFKSSLKLEPLYKSNANAVYWFNQWLLLKIYQGLLSTLSDVGVAPPDLRLSKEATDRITGQLELGQTELPGQEFSGLDIPSLEADVGQVLAMLGKTRCVLLLDDAAHAFSPEQQRDFFDFFRQVKSRTISPKAAIYPGVTVYSSTFHVGHDAEEIDVWLKPHASGYTAFMTSLLERRLPYDVFEALIADPTLLQLVCYASFGMPRALLNMVRTFYRDISKDGIEGYEITYNRSSALRAIKDVYENTLSVYSSLRVKLPLYAEFVTTGERLFDRAVEFIKTYNKALLSG